MRWPISASLAALTRSPANLLSLFLAASRSSALSSTRRVAISSRIAWRIAGKLFCSMTGAWRPSLMSVLELFCSVDDFGQAFLPLYRESLLGEQGHRERAGTLSTSEIMTILIKTLFMYNYCLRRF